MATVALGYNTPTGFTSGETITPSKLNSLGTPSVTLSAGEVDTTALADRAVTAAKLDSVVTIDSKTGNYTLVLGDRGKVIEVNSASNLTVTVPANSSVAFATGATVVVTRRGAGEVAIAGVAGVTLRSEGGKLNIKAQYNAAALIKIDTDEWLVLGALKA